MDENESIRLDAGTFLIRKRMRKIGSVNVAIDVTRREGEKSSALTSPGPGVHRVPTDTS